MRRNSVLTLWAFIGVSAFMFAGRLWVVALLLLIAFAVTIHLYSLPSEVRSVD